MPVEDVERQQQMIALRKHGYKLVQIAEMFNVSRQRVHQIIGNTGRDSGIKRMMKYADQLRQKLFIDGTITYYDLSLKYNLSISTVKSRLGSRRVYLKSLGLRKCYRCHNIKTIDKFGLCTGRPDGISGICKECNSEQAKKYYHSHKG